MLTRLIAVALLTFGLSAAFGQEFDAASIKPAAAMQPGRIMIGIRGGPGTPDPGHMSMTNVSLSDLIQNAYDVKDYQVSGPSWLGSARFDIEAKAPAGTTKEQSRVMMQNLLAERFKLVLHHSSKEESIYALLVAKNGPKLKQSAAEDPNAAANDHPPTGGVAGPRIGRDGMPMAPPGMGRGGIAMMIVPGGRMRLVANASTITSFLGPLSMQLDRPVVDMTGLTGTYDITLDFAPDPSVMQARMAAMGGPPPPPGPDGGGPTSAPTDPSGSASIFTALPDQLGLRLEARKGPVDLLVIDSVQKTPTEN